ncbi:MAG TPA: PIG-L family deacetylase [Anaerolineae bacterium]
MESILLRETRRAKRLLFVFPHPDDESFGPGGTIARYAREGAAVHYACATRGEAGSVAPERLTPFEHLPADQRLGALREGELRCAAGHLGLTGLHVLGYRDSGMPGSADNRDPRAFVNADPDRVTGELVRLVREIRPQVVVTFDPFGGYGHPDHIFAHRRTTEAFHAAGDPKRYPEAGAPYRPHKLYWASIPKRWLKVMVALMRLTRRDPTKFGHNRDINLLEVAAREYPVTTRIDVWPYFPIKVQASACHASQGGGSLLLQRFPGWMRRSILGYERFTLVEPARNGRRGIERDLFEGVNEQATDENG